MDSGEVNKIAGAAIGALLVFLLLGFFSEKTFDSGGHHDEVLAYALPIEEDAGAGEEEEEEPIDFVALIAAAEPAKGEKVFNQCKACHKVEDGANGVGPHMWSVVGRDIGGVDGYAYSNALAEHGGVWDYDNLMGFLEAPKDWAPGTKMGYAGLKDPVDRTNLIAWLNEADGSPVALETAMVAPAAAEEAGEEAEDAGEAAEAGDAAEGDEAADAGEAAEAGDAAEGGDAAEAAETANAGDAAEGGEAAETGDVAEAGDAAEGGETADAGDAAEGGEAADAGDAAEGGDEVALADTVEDGSAGAGAEPAAVNGGAYAALIAAADADAGKKVFRKCRACHVANKEQNRVGPHMVNLIGREIGGVDGFNYSDAMANHGGVWDLNALMAWLENPKAYIPGNKMAYGGLKSEEDRINVLKYIAEEGGDGSLQ